MTACDLLSNLEQGFLVLTFLQGLQHVDTDNSNINQTTPYLSMNP